MDAVTATELHIYCEKVRKTLDRIQRAHLLALSARDAAGILYRIERSTKLMRDELAISEQVKLPEYPA